MFTAGVGSRTRCAATAAHVPATTLRCIRNAAESASKAVTVPRARRWTRLANAFLSTNARVSIKESNIHLVIRNLDREHVHQISGSIPVVTIYNPFPYLHVILWLLKLWPSTCTSARWHCRSATVEERDLLANVTPSTQMQCRSSHNEEYTPCEPEHQLTCKVNWITLPFWFVRICRDDINTRFSRRL